MRLARRLAARSTAALARGETRLERLLKRTRRQNTGINIGNVRELKGTATHLAARVVARAIAIHAAVACLNIAATHLAGTVVTTTRLGLAGPANFGAAALLASFDHIGHLFKCTG